MNILTKKNEKRKHIAIVWKIKDFKFVSKNGYSYITTR